MDKMFLAQGDMVGVSFWLVAIGMIASTVFFLYEGLRVKPQWRLSLLIAALVTLVAAVHYDYNISRRRRKLISLFRLVVQ